MIQELFHVGSFVITPFGPMLMLSLLAAYWQLRRALLRLGAGDEEDASSIIFTAGILGILGGKTYYAILFGDWRLFFDRAGIVWYGSFIAGFLALVWTIHRRGLPFARTFDASAPGLALGYGVGRIGCFLVGDDYGVPTDLPWGTVFKVGLPPTDAASLRQVYGYETPPELIGAEGWVAVHPTQLYETAAAFAIWGLSLWLLKRGTRPGNLFLVIVSLLSAERFLVEFVRVKDDRFFGDFTVAQVISLLVAVVAAAVALRNRAARKEG